MTLTAWLRKYRLTPNGGALRLGITQSSVAHCLNGGQPRLDTSARIVVATGGEIQMPDLLLDPALAEQLRRNTR